MDDFSNFQDTEHMFQWLADNPESAIRNEISRILNQQVPGSQLVSINVVSAPQWLTGARPSDDNSSKAILVRTGVAFEFALRVDEPTGESHELSGVYSWVGVHLDDPGQATQRVWLDIDGTLEEFGSEGELKNRMYFA